MARRRTELLQIRLTPEEKKILKWAADAGNVSMGEMMRAFTFAFISVAKTGGPDSVLPLMKALGLLPEISDPSEPDDE